jgi:predicted MFS family arabinose efflux permease
MSRPQRGGPLRPTASYRAVLSLPRARAPFTAALLARLCYGLQGLPLLITLRDSAGSYAVAGAAASAFGLGVALLGPARARLIARHHHAFIALASGYAVTLTAVAVASMLRLPAVAIGLAVLAGLCPPPVGPVMRALWGRLAPDRAQLQRALSLDTAAESTAFALGPALAGMLIKATGAPVVLVACAALVLAGSRPLARAAAGARADMPAEGGHEAETRDSLGMKGLLRLTWPAWAIAVAVSGAEIAIVAAWGTVTVGILLALFPVGGVLGGLGYGRRDWRAPLARRPRMLTAASAACYALPALAFLPVVAGGTFLLAGACADIALIATYQLVDAAVPEGRQAEAGAWVNTAYNLGSAMGMAAGGVLAAGLGPRLSIAAMAALASGCALVTAGAGSGSTPVAREPGTLAPGHQ